MDFSLHIAPPSPVSAEYGDQSEGGYLANRSPKVAESRPLA
jgi:hypothetical protein